MNTAICDVQSSLLRKGIIPWFGTVLLKSTQRNSLRAKKARLNRGILQRLFVGDKFRWFVFFF